MNFIKQFNSYSKDLRTLFCVRFLLALAHGLSYPFLVVYLTRRGLALDVIGFLFAGHIFVKALGNLMGGPMADGLGAAKAMFIAITWRIIFTVLLGGAIGLNIAPVLIMTIYYFHALIGEAFMPACDAFVAERSEFHQRRDIFSFLRIGVNAGWAVGAALGGLLAPIVGYTALFLTTATVTSGISWILKKTLAAQNVRAATPSSIRLSLPVSIWVGSLRERAWVIYLGLLFLAFIGVDQIFSLMSVYLVRYRFATETTVGILYSLNGFLVIFLQNWITAKAKKFLLTRAIACGLLLYALGLLVLGFSNVMYLYMLSMTVITLGEVVLMPAYSALAVNLASRRGGNARRATYIGMSQFVGVLGGFVSSIFGGYLLEYLGVAKPYLPWIIISGFTVTSAIGFFFFKGAQDDY